MLNLFLCVTTSYLSVQVPFLVSLGTAAKEIMRTHGEVGDIGREGRCCFTSLKLLLTICACRILYLPLHQNKEISR